MFFILFQVSPKPKMTILTAGACGVMATTSSGTIPALVGAAVGAVVPCVKLWAMSEPVKIALATTIGTGTSAGAIAGTIASKTAASAIPGAFLGGISSAGVGSVLIGSMAAVGNSIVANPIGFLTVGTSYDETKVKFDCWKPVVHDLSEKPSKGMALRDLIRHPNIGKVSVTCGDGLPKIVIDNIWDEQFEIEYLLLGEHKELFCHAKSLNE